MHILFYLLILIILLFPTSIFLIIGYFSKKKIFFKIGYFILIAPFILIFTISIYNFLFIDKMTVAKENIYGEYIIDRKKYDGKNANWQYEHFKIKITEDDKLHLMIYNDYGKIAKVITKKIVIYDGFSNARLKINSSPDDYHLLQENPTLYRNVWSYYYVFHSSKYGNMFFIKKPWYQIN